MKIFPGQCEHFWMMIIDDETVGIYNSITYYYIYTFKDIKCTE